MRTPATSVPWSKLVWNQIIRLCVSTLIWRLLHRKPQPRLGRSPLVLILPLGACSNEKSDLHLFFTCSISSSTWSWILQGIGKMVPHPLSASLIWSAFSEERFEASKQWAAMVFFNVIFCIWSLRNDATFNSAVVSPYRLRRRFLQQIKDAV